MKNALLVGLYLTLHITAVQASDSLFNLSINPDKVISTETVDVIVDVQLKHTENDLIIINNPSPINEIRIYNEKGLLVSKRKHVSTDFKFDIGNLSSGTYCFRIQVDQEVITKMVEKK